VAVRLPLRRKPLAIPARTPAHCTLHTALEVEDGADSRYKASGEGQSSSFPTLHRGAYRFEMPRTEAQKSTKNKLRRDAKAAKRLAKLTVPRDGAREELVRRLVVSVMKKVVQRAKARTRTARWAKENPERKRQTDRTAYVANAAAAKAQGVTYEAWSEKRAEQNRSKEPYDANRRHKERKQTDPQFLVCSRLRTRLGEFMKLKNGTKAAGTMELVGCTKEYITTHLQRQLPDGESLKDYSIDHIFPMSMYDMADPVEQRRCMNYTNLQPMKLCGIGGNASCGSRPPSLELARRVARDCWPATITEADLKPETSNAVAHTDA